MKFSASLQLASSCADHASLLW